VSDETIGYEQGREVRHVECPHCHKRLQYEAWARGECCNREGDDGHKRAALAKWNDYCRRFNAVERKR